MELLDAYINFPKFTILLYNIAFYFAYFPDEIIIFLRLFLSLTIKGFIKNIQLGQCRIDFVSYLSDLAFQEFIKRVTPFLIFLYLKFNLTEPGSTDKVAFDVFKLFVMIHFICLLNTQSSKLLINMRKCFYLNTNFSQLRIMSLVTLLHLHQLFGVLFVFIRHLLVVIFHKIDNLLDTVFDTGNLYNFAHAILHSHYNIFHCNLFNSLIIQAVKLRIFVI